MVMSGGKRRVPTSQLRGEVGGVPGLRVPLTAAGGGWQGQGPSHQGDGERESSQGPCVCLGGRRPAGHT